MGAQTCDNFILFGLIMVPCSILDTDECEQTCVFLSEKATLYSLVSIASLGDSSIRYIQMEFIEYWGKSLFLNPHQ